MKEAILLFAVQATLVILLARWLYYQFLLPIILSKYLWYDDYVNLCHFIKGVNSHEALESALDAFYKFSAYKQRQNTRHHQYCEKRIVKLLKKKYLLFKNKTVIA